MIAAASLARLERLQLATSRPLAGAIAGEHRSRRHGSSLDYVDVREYQPGDDVRRLDVHHLARHDELRLKLYEADDDITVRILLDTSSSMDWRGKREVAVDAVLAIAAIALVRGDNVELTRFPGDRQPRRFRGRRGLHAIRAQLAATSWGGDTPLATAARRLLDRHHTTGLTIVVTDLLSSDWLDAIQRLPARGSEVVVVRVESDDEVEPDLDGDLSLTDVESRQLVDVSLTERHRRDYGEFRGAWLANVEHSCRRAGVAHVVLRSGDDVEHRFVSSWRAAGVVR